MSFQTQVNITPALGQPGDFASANPYSTLPGEAGQYIAGTGGVGVGLFAWLQADGKSFLNSGGAGIVPNGIIHRELNAQIVAFLAESGVTIQAGQVVNPHVKGDYFMVSTVAASVVGNKAFANLATGAMQPGAAGAVIAGFVETPYVIVSACAIGELAIISL